MFGPHYLTGVCVGSHPIPNLLQVGYRGGDDKFWSRPWQGFGRSALKKKFLGKLPCKTLYFVVNLDRSYEGDSKVKATKIQTYRGQFEQLNMKEDENIASYFLQVDEIVNAIIGLEEEIKECVIVQKVLRSLPMIFDPKISSLEERAYIDSISMGELHVIFRAYEMRIE
jgi:hypothetical protein